MRVQSGNLDVAGAATVAIGFGTLTYGVVEGAERGFGTVWWAFAISAVSLMAFVALERRIAQPLLPFALFRRRNLAAANLETFLVYAALGGMLVYIGLYLQFLGFSPFEAGLANVPISVVMILLAPKFGALADRHGPRLYLTLGPALIAAGTLLFVPMDSKSDFFVFGVPGLGLFSLGLACLVAPITATALSSAPSEFAGIASGINQTVSRLGNLLAVAVIGLAVSLVFAGRVGEGNGVPLAADQTDPALRDASVAAFRVAMLIVAGLALAGAVVGWTRISNQEVGAGEPEQAAGAVAGPGAS
jgi:MFS family permease